jgi:pimeloyl-ACP methyl ester carboxylesterase
VPRPSLNREFPLPGRTILILPNILKLHHIPARSTSARLKLVAVFAILLIASRAASAQSVPAAIYTDPPADAAHPAAMTVLHIPSHGLLINGLVYQPAGAGPHPTLVICHGLPGNEKNLDLAQAVRRAGWNAATFNYRGSWGSPGVFRFAQNLEDAGAVLAYLRDPANSARLSIDTKRIAIAGHSMGGWVAVNTAAHDRGLIGAIIISAADMGGEGNAPQDRLLALMADNMEALSGVTAESMASDVKTLAKEFRFENAAAGLIDTPLLALTSDDGLAPTTDALVHAIEAKGGHKVTEMHFATDHSYSDHRIALESAIITWLAGLR